jgi:hypothetical protein
MLQAGTLYPQKLATTSPTSGGRSVGIDRSPWSLFFVFLFPATLGLGVYSVSDRNKYQKQKKMFLRSRELPASKAARTNFKLKVIFLQGFYEIENFEL